MQKCHAKPANVEIIVQRKKVGVIVWNDMELYEFMLHKCMILRHFGAKTVEYPVPKIFKKSFLRYFMRTAAFQETKMYKM